MKMEVNTLHYKGVYYGQEQIQCHSGVNTEQTKRNGHEWQKS